MTEQKIKLPDGRILCYATYGNPKHQPVLYFHGTPSSRLELLQLNLYELNIEQLLQQQELYIIAIDRPGLGLSDFNPTGSFLSCAADTAFLCRQLGINSTAVLCWSGGGPYALALAHQHPELIQQVAILCGFTRPFDPEVQKEMYANKWYFRTARNLPRLLRLIMNATRQQPLRKPPPQLLTSSPDVDYNLLKQPEKYHAMTHNSFKEACRQKAVGPVYEAALYFEPFGFSLSAIRQPVQYWWGTEDSMVTRSHPEAVRKEIPFSQVHVLKGEGHISVFVRCFPEALQHIKKTIA